MASAYPGATSSMASTAARTPAISANLANAGRTWLPIFDDQPTGSIGTIAVGVRASESAETWRAWSSVGVPRRPTRRPTC